MIRRLTLKKIEELAGRKGVRRIAVENFLFSADLTMGFSIHMANLDLDTKLYRWNAATRNAIATGLRKMYGR